MSKWEKMKEIAQNDLEALKRAETSYGDSWKRRGGVGAFMMLARKFDRIEHQATKHGWDIFRAGEVYKGEAGLLDDIRDLRRYLILVENDILVNTVFQKAEELSDSADYQKSKLMSKLTTKSVKKDGKEK
jgi:hypothetical protein|tara:strand:+ start:88 stop:477 length:390 start_codon:yes stop_codon:yes gene_type:complete